MNAKILLVLSIVGLLQVLHVSQVKCSDAATCLNPLLCNPTSIQLCTVGCADMCPVATALHTPTCSVHYDAQERPISVDCVCPDACANPLTTTPIPRGWLVGMGGVAVGCGAQSITNTTYNCATHSYHIEWGYGEPGCPSPIV